MNLALSIGKAKVEWNRECDLAGIRDAGQIPIGRTEDGHPVLDRRGEGGGARKQHRQSQNVA